MIELQVTTMLNSVYICVCVHTVVCVCNQIYQKGMVLAIQAQFQLDTHFLSSFVGYINGPTAHVFMLKLEQSAFTQASFSSLSDIHECSGGLQLAPSSLGKQTDDCESPFDWPMSLSMLCVTSGGENGKSFGCF